MSSAPTNTVNDEGSRLKPSVKLREENSRFNQCVTVVTVTGREGRMGWGWAAGGGGQKAFCFAAHLHSYMVVRCDAVTGRQNVALGDHCRRADFCLVIEQNTRQPWVVYDLGKVAADDLQKAEVGPVQTTQSQRLMAGMTVGSLCR